MSIELDGCDMPTVKHSALSAWTHSGTTWVEPGAVYLWYGHGMQVAIDGAGRLVIPKSLREAIGVADGGVVEMELVDGALVLSPPTVRKRVVERDGRAVVVADEPLPPLSDDVVRSTLDTVRR
jgi:AbrB family looped-hinge helix DNA binding protein